MEELRIKVINNNAVVPKYQTIGAAGLDLHATETAGILPGEHVLIGTGLAVAIPSGYVGLLFPRSGNAVKHRMNLINCVGVIDADYRGEIKIPLNNESDEAFIVDPGDRIAQLVIMPYNQVQITVTDELDVTSRGNGGFGSTGLSSNKPM